MPFDMSGHYTLPADQPVAGQVARASQINAIFADIAGALTYVYGISANANLNASLLSTGTLPAARLPAFSGDCPSAGGTATLVCPTSVGVPIATHAQGTFNITWNGFSVAPSAVNVLYSRSGSQVTLEIPNAAGGALGTPSGSSIAWAAGGVPAGLRPVANQMVALPCVEDAGTYVTGGGYAEVLSTGAVIFYKAAFAGFTASANGGIGTCNGVAVIFSYTIDY